MHIDKQQLLISGCGKCYKFETVKRIRILLNPRQCGRALTLDAVLLLLINFSSVFRSLHQNHHKLSLVHTNGISTSTSPNARHTHAQHQSSTNQTISARAYAWRLCLCLSHYCEAGFSVFLLQTGLPSHKKETMSLRIYSRILVRRLYQLSRFYYSYYSYSYSYSYSYYYYYYYYNW